MQSLWIQYFIHQIINKNLSPEPYQFQLGATRFYICKKSHDTDWTNVMPAGFVLLAVPRMVWAVLVMDVGSLYRIHTCKFCSRIYSAEYVKNRCSTNFNYLGKCYGGEPGEVSSIESNGTECAVAFFAIC
jgi:hypothetical protein